MKKTHRFILDVKTNDSRRDARNAVLIAFAGRDPDGCTFNLRSNFPKRVQQKSVVTCVYCGHQYADGTPTSKAKALTDHVTTCEKHPMKRVFDALANLVGSRDKNELQEMRDKIRIIPMPADNRSKLNDSIDALIELLP